MTRFYEPDLGANPDSPFARDAAKKLVRRSYWLDMNDRSLVMAMVNGIDAHLTNDEKRAHLTDLVATISSTKCAFRRFCRRENSWHFHVRACRILGAAQFCLSPTLFDCALVKSSSYSRSKHPREQSR